MSNQSSWPIKTLLLGKGFENANDSNAAPDIRYGKSWLDVGGGTMATLMNDGNGLFTFDQSPQIPHVNQPFGLDDVLRINFSNNFVSTYLWYETGELIPELWCFQRVVPSPEDIVAEAGTIYFTSDGDNIHFAGLGAQNGPDFSLQKISYSGTAAATFSFKHYGTGESIGSPVTIDPGSNGNPGVKTILLDEPISLPEIDVTSQSQECFNPIWVSVTTDDPKSDYKTAFDFGINYDSNGNPHLTERIPIGGDIGELLRMTINEYKVDNLPVILVGAMDLDPEIESTKS